MIDDWQKDKIVSMRNDGCGYRLIADILGLKRDQVRDYCRRNRLSGTKGYVAPRVKRFCIICGKETLRKNKYCSPECEREEAKRRRKEKEDKKPTLVCPLCGIEFKPRDLREKYCCREHGIKYRQILRTPWKNKNRTCLYCANIFTPNFKEQKYCNKTCAGRATIKENEKFNKFNKTVTHDEYVERINQLFEYSIQVVTKYVSSREKIKYKCLMCEHEFERNAKDMLGSMGCPRCQRIQSQGSILIEEWLLKHNISFQKEYRFSDCRNKLPLPFDFAVINNGLCIGVIEFNGEHHYRVINHWGGLIKLKGVQHNDKIKRNYCKKQKIPLIDIDYNELDYLDEILSTTIMQYVVVKPRIKTKKHYNTSPGLWAVDN